MAVLVTRPHPDGETTAASLRARGFAVMSAPMLRFEPLPFRDDEDANYGAVIATSANALRGVEPQLAGSALLKLPLLAVGEHTAAAASHAGFTKVITAGGDGAALRDLAGELSKDGFTVVTQTTYKMVPAKSLPREVCDAFVAGEIEAVLHYSRRSARAFLDAARDGGVEISALALPQCCISAGVAAIVREAGASQVAVASSADENALFEALTRALQA